MRGTGAVIRAGASVWRVVRPSVPATIRATRPPPFSLDAWAAECARWAEPLGARRPAGVAVVYGRTATSIGRMETKASGLLAVLAIVTAATASLIAPHHPLGVRLPALVALAYVVSAAVGCCVPLRPQRTYDLDVEEALSATDGHAEMLAAASLNEPRVTHLALVLRAAVLDLARGAAVAVTAVVAASV